MSKKDKKKPQEEGVVVPGWIVSFSDMVTLLLAFFVLLQTFAHTRDPELFFAGQGSFKRAVSGFGMTAWFGGQMEQPLKNFKKLKYPVKAKKDEHSRERLDAEDEQIRQSFKNLQQNMEVMADNMSKDVITPFKTSIMFKAASAELNEQSRNELANISLSIRQNTDVRNVKVYVVGFAADVKYRKARMLLSARRATAAQLYLSAMLQAGGSEKWNVYAWGAGQEGQWCKTYSVDPKRTHVVVLVMRAK